MQELEYVKVMSKQDVQNVYGFFINKNESKKKESESVVKDNSDLLLQLYDKIDFEQNKINTQTEVDYRKSLYLHKVKKCLCGSSMNFISAFGFWGCPKYKDGHKHITFNSEPPRFYLGNNLAKNWLSEIIKLSNLKGKIREKELFEFYKSNNMQDLKLKYSNIKTESHLYSYIRTNKISKEFEAKCHEELKNHYPKIQPQLGLKYKYINEKEKMCFIDFIASNSTNVVIHECKTNEGDKRDSQKDLYINLVGFLMSKKNDPRILMFKYLIEKNG